MLPQGRQLIQIHKALLIVHFSFKINDLKLSKHQLIYAAQDVLFLHKLKLQLDEILIREGKMNLALECFESLKIRVKLDLEGFQELDIFAH